MTEPNNLTAAFPTAVFTRWFPWSALASDRSDPIAPSLAQVGCYLLARFDEPPTDGPADPTHPAVFYIGETHGNTTSLRGRLQQFGRSAGFYGAQQDGHYAAWRYPEVFAMDRASLPGTAEAGSCKSEHVYFAVCPWSGAYPRATRGVFPNLIEQQALWRHAFVHQALPALNNSGRVATGNAPPCPTFPEPTLSAILNPEFAQRTEACAEVLDAIAVAAGYRARRGSAKRHRWDSWTGARRQTGTNTHYLGWRAEDPAGITLHRYRGHHDEFGADEPPARTPAELQSLVIAFWDNWWGA